LIKNQHYANGVIVNAEIIDLAAGIVTIEEHGRVISSRPLTDAERAAYAPPPATDSEKLAAARQALAALTGIDGPILATDIADALADVAAALED